MYKRACGGLVFQTEIRFATLALVRNEVFEAQYSVELELLDLLLPSSMFFSSRSSRIVSIVTHRSSE